eukprot:CAMPEP_0179197734 /NCGR_PEP_ID=MMETSP0796-20121207/98337_1 /TAXON_ID=73915 /ORGANISM="Pyrodinium bahamense, Strain pbaha01" /LENGTH=484 /DNA_ID=CAMNT_0020902163 /DNA_START=1 /DNA_END=1455 /DNA_ORIENTATION=+
MAGIRPVSASPSRVAVRRATTGGAGLPDLQSPTESQGRFPAAPLDSPLESSSRQWNSSLQSLPEDERYSRRESPYLGGHERRESLQPRSSGSESFQTLDISKVNKVRHNSQRVDTFRTLSGSAARPGTADARSGGSWALQVELLEALRRDLQEGLREEFWAGVDRLRADIAQAAAQTVAEVKLDVKAEAAVLCQSFARAANTDFSHVCREVQKVHAEVEALRRVPGSAAGQEAAGSTGAQDADLTMLLEELRCTRTVLLDAIRGAGGGSAEKGEEAHGRRTCAEPAAPLLEELRRAVREDLRDVKACMAQMDASILQEVKGSRASLEARLELFGQALSAIRDRVDRNSSSTPAVGAQEAAKLSEDLTEILARLDGLEADGRQLRSRCEGDLGQILLRMTSCHEELLVEVQRPARRDRSRRQSAPVNALAGGSPESERGDKLEDGGWAEDLHVPELTAATVAQSSDTSRSIRLGCSGMGGNGVVP